MNYLVRVSINANYAAKAVTEDRKLIRPLFDNLGTKVVERVVDCCETFGTVVMSGNSISEVEECVKKSWNNLNPGYANAIKVFVAEDKKTEATNTLRSVYAGYFGWDDYMEYATRIVSAFPFIKKGNGLKQLIGTNVLVSIDQGCGFSQLLSSFADLLDKVGVWDKPLKSYWEYKIDESEKANKNTTKSVLENLWEKENNYTVVGLDISYYLPVEKRDELRNFLYRLEKLQDKYVFVFAVPYLSDSAYKDIRNAIADVITIRELRFEPVGDLILREFIKDDIGRLGYSLSDDTYAVIEKRLANERKDGRFYGFKTAENIMRDILWEKACTDARKEGNGEAFNSETISYEDIAALADASESTEKTGFEELDGLIGMDEIRKRIEEIVSQVKLSMKNPSMDRPCLHMRFTGAPGTGKTTVARIIGKVFRENGILSKGGFFEHSARSLCGEYVGQTAPKTSQICRDAYGSVLFIDEAYALYAGDSVNNNDFGREALTTLIAEMENHRDDMVVIMAGYTDDMDRLMEGNAGLRSRMPYKIEFKSYTRKQLKDIFMMNVNKHFKCEDGLEDVVEKYFSNLSDSYVESKEFANARFVRNLYERTWSKAAVRASEFGNTDVIISIADFISASEEKEFSEKLMLAKKIGF